MATAVIDAAIYFAKPYHSWERGLNENTNGLIRQYIPKKTMLAVYSPDDIVDIQETINNRPRKTLGYLTPHEVFVEGKIRAKNIQEIRWTPVDKAAPCMYIYANVNRCR